MSLTTLTLPHLPPDLQLHIALFTSVRNCAHLRAQLLEGNRDFEYALIDASTILSPTHLHAAIFRACNDYTNQRMRTRNVHSEVVFCLGVNNNIGQTLRTFGVSEATEDLLVVKVRCPRLGLRGRGQEEEEEEEDVWEHLKGWVEGEAVEYSEVQVKRRCDVEKVRRVYKLGGGGQSVKARKRKDGRMEGGQAVELAESPGQGKETEVGQQRELEMQILGLMALRGAV